MCKGAFMLKGIKQSDKGLLPVIQNYGCLFLCFAYASPLIFEGAEGRKALNKIWTEATKKGYSKRKIIFTVSSRRPTKNIHTNLRTPASVVLPKPQMKQDQCRTCLGLVAVQS